MIEVLTTLEQIVCCRCGMVFGIPEQWSRQKREKGGEFFCPAGHLLTFGESELQRTKRQLMQAEQRLDQEKAAKEHQRKQREKAERKLSATKGVVTRLKNRTAQGRCPCCDASFPNLEQHMRDAHPDFETMDKPNSESAAESEG